MRVNGAYGGRPFFIYVPELDPDQGCRGPVEGYKIYLNIPGEIPRPSSPYVWIPFVGDVFVYYKPQMVKTSPNLRYYKPSVRQCFFNSERRLRFYKVYTQHNCKLKCLANLTKGQCGCVKLAMPGMINHIFVYSKFEFQTIFRKLSFFPYTIVIFFFFYRRRAYSSVRYIPNEVLQ